MLVDKVTLQIKAGNGGEGAVSFRLKLSSGKEGPNGGDGGNGGSIYFQGSANVSDLREFRYKKSIKAADGEKGGRRNHFGKDAPDTTVLVPFGTHVTDTSTAETYEISDTVPLLLAQGGKGGRGNYSFPENPDHAENGGPGQERTLDVELKLIAEIGIIGLPNAGKSSILAKLTNAKPTIADYPFTTLEPNIGMLGRHAIADIPGVIEGASQGKGLGITFLKHIQKTKILVHCIDLAQDDLVRAYETIRTEMGGHDPKLLDKPEIIVLNKTDLVDEKTVEKNKKLFKGKAQTILTCSIHDPESIKRLRDTIISLLEAPQA